MKRIPRAAVFVGVWLVTCAVFSGAVAADFVLYDDPLYVTQNPVVQRGLSFETVRWAFTDTATTSNWHPLTWLSHLLDVELFGLSPAGHHLTSVLLHASNALLLALLVGRITGSVGWSTLGALLFAVHPLRVESVAWVSERKDVLSGFFLLLTLIFWQRFALGSSRARGFYVLAVLAGALGLLAKSMLVTLPALLLVFDLWPLQRPWGVRLVVEKVPFFVLSLAFSLVTLGAQRGAMSSVEALPLSMRLDNALVSLARYVQKSVLPVELAVPYHYPLDGWPRTTTSTSLLVVVMLTVLAVLLLVRRRQRAPLAAWLWFAGSLVPVLGLVTVGSASMADRYTYVPHLLPAIAVAVGGAATGRRWIPLVGMVVLVLAFLTVRQAEVWQDSRSLFEHTVEVQPENGSAWMSLARARLAARDAAGAEDAAARAVQIDDAEAQLSTTRERPNAAENRVFLGRLLAGRGAHREAVAQYVEALSLDAQPAAPHALLAISLLALGDVASGRNEAEIAQRSGVLPNELRVQLEQALAQPAPSP